jgi:hypothetical protein
VIAITFAPGTLLAVTVKLVDPEIVPEVAVTVTVPVGPGELASPAALIVSTPEGVADQVTWLVKFWGVLLEKVPVAVNCSVPPEVREVLAGVTAMETRPTTGAPVTVNWVDPEIVPEVAVMVGFPVEPEPGEVARPAALIVTTPEGEADQVTWEVKF